MRGTEQQFLSLQKGFHELIPANLLRPFDERELELLIGGICKIDVVDWQNNTRLKVSLHCFLLTFSYLYVIELTGFYSNDFIQQFFIIWLETKSCRVSYPKLTVKYDRT